MADHKPKSNMNNYVYAGGLSVWRSLSDKYHSRQLKVLWTTGGALDNWRYFGQLLLLLANGDTSD